MPADLNKQSRAVWATGNVAPDVCRPRPVLGGQVN
jgi:hypothetical protein